MGHDWCMRGPYAVLWPCDPDSAASYPDLSGLGERSPPLCCAAVALSGAVLAHRADWSCASLPSVPDRLAHMLHHRWDLPRPLAVGIASPATTINAALAAERLAVDFAETAVLAVLPYAVTATDRARVREICRSTYAVPA